MISKGNISYGSIRPKPYELGLIRFIDLDWASDDRKTNWGMASILVTILCLGWSKNK